MCHTSRNIAIYFLKSKMATPPWTLKILCHSIINVTFPTILLCFRPSTCHNFWDIATKKYKMTAEWCHLRLSKCYYEILFISYNFVSDRNPPSSILFGKSLFRLKMALKFYKIKITQMCLCHHLLIWKMKLNEISLFPMRREVHTMLKVRNLFVSVFLYRGHFHVALNFLKFHHFR